MVGVQPPIGKQRLWWELWTKIYELWQTQSMDAITSVVDQFVTKFIELADILKSSVDISVWFICLEMSFY